MSEAAEQLAFDQGVQVPAGLKRREDVTVTISGEMKRFSLRVKPADHETFTEKTGLDLPQGVSNTSLDDGVRIYCLGPDEWLLMAENGSTLTSKIEKAPAPYSLTDISHRNIGIGIEGEGAPLLLNVGCPLDLSTEAFPVGKASRTVYERAEIILHRRDLLSFDVDIWRSFAPYFLRLAEKSV